MLGEYYQACISFTLISLNSLFFRVTIVTLCRELPGMSVLLRAFLSTDFSFSVGLFSSRLGANIYSIIQVPYRRIKEAFGLV